MTSSFDIRKGNESDLDSISEMVKLAIPLMHESKNFQWDDEYPTREKFVDDIHFERISLCMYLNYYRTTYEISRILCYYN